MPLSKRSDMGKVLVTGGAGYIGSHTVVELEKAGYQPVIVDNFSNSKPEVLHRLAKICGRDLPFYRVDVCDEAALNEVFEREEITDVIHFAGYKAVGESVADPVKYYRNNVGSTVVLLRCMQKHGVKRIVFSSSATVYGEPESVPIPETAALHPTNPYGNTKYINELLLTDVSVADPALSVALLRYFNPIGAHESGWIGEDPNGIPNNLLPYVAQVAVGKLPQLNVFGNDYPTKDGTGVRDYIHVVDLARGHVCALQKLAAQSGVFICNLGTGVGYSVLDVVSAFEKASGRKIPYRFVPRRSGDVAEYYADPTKAKKELGWQSEFSLEEMCRDTWRWQSQNPNGYDE